MCQRLLELVLPRQTGVSVANEQIDLECAHSDELDRPVSTSFSACDCIVCFGLV